VVTAELLAARREAINASADLQRLLAHLTESAAPVLARTPVIPEQKALLSVDGGVCPDDGAALEFDPWSPEAHRCPQCGKAFRGERHDRAWAKYQHLWLAERAAHLAALAALGDNPPAGARARELLAGYARRYFRYPNADNVLGPSRLFFSTYLESLWVANYLSAAWLLRQADALDPETVRGVNIVADEAATLIGDFDEGFSNRQTWNNAALTAVAVWFEDEDLAQRAIEGPTGLLAHLRGFGSDGMWYEGENYHLFALRGLLTGAGWAGLAGVDFFAEPQLAERVVRALLAPGMTALPDLTFPARKDARYGVSLAQPMYVETWEVGLGRLGKRDTENGTRELAAWLRALYTAPAPTRELFESYLHEAPVSRVPSPVSRTSLSWWSLLEMAPELPDGEPWQPASALLPSQGLAILRGGGRSRYVSLECGPSGGGHGHPDRLDLTLHAGGVHWLPDPGTGSYVARDLFWYRSTLAHNAPRLDGVSQPLGNAVCEAFDSRGDWAWVRGRWGNVSRAVISGPAYVVDVVELAGGEEHLLELPWHLQGRGDVSVPGRWEAGALDEDFVTRVERFVPSGRESLRIEHGAQGARLAAHLVVPGELWRAEGPGLPRMGSRATFYLVRARGRNLRLVAVLEPAAGDAVVTGVKVAGGVVEVATTRGVERHYDEGSMWRVEAAGGGGAVRLGGPVEVEPPFAPILEIDPPRPATGLAYRVANSPALDGTLEGFDLSEPLRLDTEDQYRRAEEPYGGPEELAAVAYAGWDESALYLAVEVTKADLCFRGSDAPPLRLDNEPDDIHADGGQVYLRDLEGGALFGYLVVPEPGDGQRGEVRVRSAGGTAADPRGVRGRWRRTPDGYRVTLAVTWPEAIHPHVGGRVGFDVLVNEMLPGRQRRAGQLVWSGGDGWVWLRGDRQDAERLGTLELVG
jgi:heparinase II/III-like protein